MHYLIIKSGTRFTKALWTVLLITLALSITFFSCQKSDSQDKPGLVGIYYSEPDLTSIKAVMVLTSLEQNWDETVDSISDIHDRLSEKTGKL